ncbi:MAG: rubrerythrin family protein [bacterium]|nr:rubrerythrin family protein [bacterium]
MELKGSKTEENLKAAFAGESQARNKYTYYAAVAKQEGYEQIAKIFLETADNEKEHAKVHFKYLDGISNTLDNLKDASAGEHYEETEMYPEFAKVAREEGFEDIAKSFEEIGHAEIAHEKRYNKLIVNIENGIVFEKEESVKWKCDNCGYVHEGNTPPDSCPACKHAKNFFEVLLENY